MKHEKQVLPPGSWIEKAGCTNLPQDINFFPEIRADDAPAKAVCLDCEVMIDCLDYAVTNEIGHGIWGGMSDRERALNLKKLQKAATERALDKKYRRI